MKLCDICGRKIDECYDVNGRRKIILDVEQKVYTPISFVDTADVDTGFPAIRNNLSAAVHLCPGKSKKDFLKPDVPR